MLPKSKSRVADSWESDGLLVEQSEPQKKKPRARTSHAHPVDEYDEDAGRQASLQFVNWGTWQEKFRADETLRIKEFITKFQGDVDQLQNQVLVELQTSEETLIDADTMRVERLAKAYNGNKNIPAPDSSRKVKERAYLPNRKSHPLHAHGREILRACHNLPECHERAEGISKVRKLSPPGTKWSEDGEYLKELLQYGRQYAEGIQRCIIVPNENSSTLLNVDEGKLSETGKIAIRLMPKSRESLQKESWAKAAQAQVRGLSMLVKSVPEEK